MRANTPEEAMGRDMTIEGFCDYRERLSEVVQRFISSSMKAHREELRETIRSMLFDENAAQSVLPPFTRSDARLASRLFLDFEEIVSSYLSLRDVEVYLGRFPCRDTGISPRRYLRYHIERYLNEVYVFEQRFRAYLNLLRKRYRMSPIRQDMEDATRDLKELISSSLSGIVSLRNQHVHERRYSDPDFYRLSFLEMLATDEAEDEIYLEFYRLRCKEMRDKWIQRIISNNDTTERLFNACCQRLYQVLFDEGGRFVFPHDS